MEVNLSIHVPKQVRTDPVQVRPGPNPLAHSDSNNKQLSLEGSAQTELQGRVAPAQREFQERVAPAQREFQGRVVAPAQTELQGRVAPAQREFQGRVAPAQREFQGHVAPAQREFQGRVVAPAQREFQGRVAPAQREFQGRVAPAQREFQGRVAPAQREFQGRVAPAQREFQGHVAPTQREFQGRVVAPAQREFQGRVAPAQREFQGRVAPAQREFQGRVAPAQREFQGRVAPAQREFQGRVAPAQREFQGRVAPAQRDLQERVAPGGAQVRGRVVPPQAAVVGRDASPQTVPRRGGAPARAEVRGRVASDQDETKSFQDAGEKQTASGASVPSQQQQQGPNGRRPVYSVDDPRIHEHPDSVNRFQSLGSQPSGLYLNHQVARGFASPRNQAINGYRVPSFDPRYQVVQSEYQYLRYEGEAKRGQVSYTGVKHRAESGYGSLENRGIDSSHSSASYPPHPSPYPGTQTSSSFPWKVEPKYQHPNPHLAKAGLSDYRTVGYLLRQDQHVNTERFDPEKRQHAAHAGHFSERSRLPPPQQHVSPRRERFDGRPHPQAGATVARGSEVTAGSQGRRGTETHHGDYLDVSRMADMAGAQYGDRAQLIQQIQQSQVDRSRSPPYPTYDFKKPEELHPSEPFAGTKDSPSGRGPGGGYGSSSGYDSRDKGSKDGTIRQGFHAQDGSVGDPGSSEFFLSQRNMEPFAKTGAHGARGGSGGEHGPFRDPGANDHVRNGSLTDDDKIHGTNRTSEGDDSDTEAERGLDILRQLHEQEEAARRLQEEDEDEEEEEEAAAAAGAVVDYDDVRNARQSSHPKRKPRGGYRPRRGDDYSEGGDSGSETPTNRSSQNYTDTYRTDDDSAQADPGDYYYRPARARDQTTRDLYRSPGRRPRPQPGRGRGSDLEQGSDEDGDEGGETPTNGGYYYGRPQAKENRPARGRNGRPAKRQGRRGSDQGSLRGDVDRGGPAAPAGEPTYYSLSRRHYLPLQVSSEPAYSRDPSPGSAHQRLDPGGDLDVARSQSQQDGETYYALRLLADSNDTSGRSSSVDESWVSFDRYSRRAVRAQVLGKAEQLLHERRHKELSSIREVSGKGASRRGRKTGSGRGGGGDGAGGRGGVNTRSRLPLRRGQGDQPRRAGRKVAFMADDEEDNWIDPEGDAQFQEALHSFRLAGRGRADLDRVRRSRLRGLNARLKKGRAPRRWGANHRRKHGAQSPSDFDQFSTGSEEDALRYGPGHGDLARYEMQRHQGYGPATDRSDLDLTQRKARRVWFFRNGDQDFKPKMVLISYKTFPTLKVLLAALGKEVPIVSGVKYIFSWPEGREVKSTAELQNGCYYVCSGVNRLTRVNYGSNREQFWHGGKMKHDETHLFTHGNGVAGPSPQSHSKPHVITVISNLYRDSHEKMILNPSTTQNFEELLVDLQNMVNIPHPPVRALYTETKPHVKVESFSQLFRDLKDHKNFLVCGEEGVPVEPKKRPLPSSNSSNDSVGKRSQRIAKQARADGRSSDSVSPSRRVAARRTEPVRCEINGKKRDFFAPSLPFLDSDGARPDKKLQLEWVYGFRGRDVKQNLIVLPNTGELVYFVAAVIVLYDRKTHTQKHYTGHTEEVTCIALHTRYPYIASGQVSGRTPEGSAHVRVWCGLTLSTFAVIGIGEFKHGICCVSFSENETSGDLLLAVDDSNRHVMSVWEWTREDRDKPCASTTTTNDPVVYGCFYPFDDKILITFGKQHMYFWTVFWNRDDGKILRDKKSGVFEDTAPKFVTTVCFSASRDVITGDSTGSMLVWVPDDDDIFRIHRQRSQPMKFAHKNNVSSLVMLSDGVLLSAGGSEIKAWDSLMGYKLLKERVMPEVYGAIRKIVAVSSNGIDGYLFVGTAKDIILEGSMQSKFRPLVQGHSEELWAVKAHPTEHSFFTAGHDGTLVKWSADDHRLIWSAKDKPFTSIAVDPLGQLVAVGTTSGKVSLYGCGDGDNRERKNFQVGQAQINALSFSPDGSQLAVGCHDGFVHIYVIHEDGQVFKQQSAALRHSGCFVMHLDWSSDCRYIQTLLGDYDLIFWDVHNMQKLKTGRTLRDVNWASFSCPVGYPLIGAWQVMEKGEVINVACRSKYLDYILAGDSRGRIRLYKYPSTQPRAECRQVKPFSSNTTAAEFLSDGSGVLVSGGSDAALMQFALRDK